MRRRQLYVYCRQMLANGNGLVSTDIDRLLPGAQDGTARRSRKDEQKGIPVMFKSTRVIQAGMPGMWQISG